MTIKWKKIYADLDEHRKELGLSWRKLGRSMSLTASSFTRLSQDKPLSVSNISKVLSELGVAQDFLGTYTKPK